MILRDCGTKQYVLRPHSRVGGLQTYFTHSTFCRVSKSAVACRPTLLTLLSYSLYFEAFRPTLPHSRVILRDEAESGEEKKKRKNIINTLTAAAKQGQKAARGKEKLEEEKSKKYKKYSYCSGEARIQSGARKRKTCKKIKNTHTAAAKQGQKAARGKEKRRRLQEQGMLYIYTHKYIIYTYI